MLALLYNLTTTAYFLTIRISAHFSRKARKWVDGRKDLFQKLRSDLRTNSAPLIWFHCASLGEFEQGRPLIELFKKERPNHKILLTFFSPSGYEIRKDYPQADWVHYLPADTRKNAKQFLDIVRPDMAIFVKYEFWYHFLSQLNERNIPTFLIAAVFRPGQPFFQWYGRLHRQMLGCFDKIYVQEESSAELVKKVGIKEVTVAGDTRVDRVGDIARSAPAYPAIADFCGGEKVFIAGSTWPEDEKILAGYFTEEELQNQKLIIAPHDISEAHLRAIESTFPVTVRYSQLTPDRLPADSPKILIIDNIGMLSGLYQFGKVAYIGGGFGEGIHNILEPMAFHLPVVHGPRFGKFPEARQMNAEGGSFCIRNLSELRQTLKKLEDPLNYEGARSVVAAYMKSGEGATRLIYDDLQGFPAEYAK